MVHLLAEHRKPHPVVEREVVSVGVRGPKAVDAAGFQPPLCLDLVEQLLRVGEQLARRGAMRGVVEDRGVLALQLPGMEEKGPVDVLAELGDRGLDHFPADKRRLCQVGERQAKALGPCVHQRQQGPA